VPYQPSFSLNFLLNDSVATAPILEISSHCPAFPSLQRIEAEVHFSAIRGKSLNGIIKFFKNLTKI
jgi:hypothetical protein